MVLIDVDDVSVAYGPTKALSGVSVRIERGERVAVIGPSGSGKSTLLGVLSGLVAPTSGNVVFDGEPVTDTNRWRTRYGHRIASIPQQLHLSGRLRVVHNVNAGRLAEWSTARALTSLVIPREADEARSALAAVGMADKLYERTDRLSGGEQQRVAIARALRQDPALILADEPTASLDPRLAAEVMDLLIGVGGAAGRTLVVSQHDVGLALRTCSRVIAMRAGRVAFDGDAGALDHDAIANLYAS